MSFVIPVALQIHFFSKNKNDAGYMQEPNRTLLGKNGNIVISAEPDSSHGLSGELEGTSGTGIILEVDRFFGFNIHGK